ncbi:28S ribosomal protein S15, mitochondrial [Rhinatrema bivittatum]|uniref:28S ribosomal protein S15, mitochondrial n=1 Tax=Rhinatrema bivittatum TaxID=194408 RepID=UPI00112D682A|nr:28S ribosomal protein S15, mitochondrial [Rhinatrema bivittatum]
MTSVLKWRRPRCECLRSRVSVSVGSDELRDSGDTMLPVLLRRAMGVVLSRRGPGAVPHLQQQQAGNGLLLQAARNYARGAKKRQEVISQLDDLPPTMLKKDYASVQLVEKVDDVVRRLLSLEMASQKEKMKIKTQQLVEKVKRNANDNGSAEAQIAGLTAKIRNFQEHVQKHPKDKANKRYMLMAIDRRKKMLKYLRRTRYEAFENVCKQLDIEYVLPLQYCRRPTRRWLAKKELCIKVFNEVKKKREAERSKQRQAAAAKEKPPVGEGVLP